MNTELYDVLDISKNATDSEIKKAYHKCAQKYHPDKTHGDKEAEEKYKKCVHAYEILMHPQKREMYDMYGSTEERPTINPFDMFRQFEKRQNLPVLHVNVTMKELYFGVTKEVSYNKQVVCDVCHGVGSEKPPIKCSTCHGRGQTIKTIRQGPMQFQTAVVCETCHGQKVSIKVEDRCHCCKGEKTIVKDFTLNVIIKAGMHWGETIVNDNSDLVVLLIQEGIDVYTRTGNNLHVTLPISFIQCITGKGIYVDHINDERINIQYDGIIQPNAMKKLINYGMPTSNNGYGDLYITFQVLIDIDQTILTNMIAMYPKQLEEGLLLHDADSIPKEEQQEEHQQQHTTTCNQQ